MANSLYVNKVEYGNQTIIDLTGDTVTAADVRQGVSFHLPSGASGIGTAVNGYTIYMTTTSPEFYGQTITVSQNGSVIGTTSFDNQGNAQYSVDNVGTYTVSVTASGTTVSEEVVVSQIEIELEAGFQYKRWLGLTDLDPDDYASLAAVLADEEAVRQLMTRHASVDYLASFTADDTSIVTILNDDIAAKWITCTAYAEDVLTDAYGALMGTIGKYGYGKWVITDATTTPPTWGALGIVPIMTSNSAPYGEAIGTSVFSSSYAYYYAFDNVDSSRWLPTDKTANQYVGYKFSTPVCVKRAVVTLEKGSNPADITMNVIGSNDGTTWSNPIGTATTSAGQVVIDCESNDDFYLYYAITSPGKWSQGGTGYWAVHALQFYGRQMTVSVPKMTSNTAPYGEASANAEYSANYAAWKAFMNDPAITKSWSPLLSSGTTPNTGWIKYNFGNKVKLGFVLIFTRSVNSWTGFIEGYDGENWETIHTISTPQTGNNYPSISTSHIYAAPVTTAKAYTAFRFTSTSYRVGGTGSGYAEPDVNMLQFFGFDYSEKEWDEHPRHYIYDHGVELETIDSNVPSVGGDLTGVINKSSWTNDTAGSKDSNHLVMRNVNTSTPYKYVPFATTNKIDLTAFSLMFVRAYTMTPTAKYAGQMVVGDYRNGYYMNNTTQRASAYKEVNATANPISPLNALDIANVNGEKYAVVHCLAAGDLYADVDEWWLE